MLALTSPIIGFILLILISSQAPVLAKELELDIEQIEKVVELWEEELEGFDEVPAEDIPDLNDKVLHIVEKAPGTDGQSYIVYKQMTVDSAKYTRHWAYLRRFKAMSAVEWNPMENPRDNVADGDFVELFIPTLFTHHRCNGIISTPAQSIHNYFYRHEEKCTVPNPYQDCCGGPDAVKEDVDFTHVGKSIAGKEIIEEDEDYADPVDSYVDDYNNMRRRRREVVMKAKIPDDQLEEIKDALANIQGPPGYSALGEFYQNVLEVVNGSKIVYLARQRVDAAAAESRASGQPCEIEDAETKMMTSFDRSPEGIPALEDVNSSFTGYISCNYHDETNKRLAQDRMGVNVARFYVHKLRGQCVLHASEKAAALFTNDMIRVTTGLRTELHPDNELISKPLLSKQEWVDVISSVFFVSFSNAYMDVAEKKSRNVNDNQNPVGEEISWTVRTLTVMVIRVVELVDDLLETHVVKTLQLIAAAVKEKFYATLYEYLKLESICKEQGLYCTKQLEINHNDKLQLLSLMQFVVFGSSGTLIKKERTVHMEFNHFYVNTLDHIKGILQNLRMIRDSIEDEADKTAEQDKENEVQFA